MQGITLIAIALLFSGGLALKTNGGILQAKRQGASKRAMPRHELPEAVIQKAALQGRSLEDIHKAAVKSHETPQASLRASSWSTKIPDIEVNLALAQQWMSVSTEPNVNSSSGTLLNADAPNGTLVMVAGVKDAPHYYDCGLAMNTAWGAMSRNPCDMKVWTSSDKMREMVPECSKLRYGERYTESYRALKLDQDTWCGGPFCSPACPDGVNCIRSYKFPFSPMCERNVTVASLSEPEAQPGPSASGSLALAIGAVIMCVGFAFIPTPKPRAARGNKW